MHYKSKNIRDIKDVEAQPLAEIAPPVTHPATTVFVVSCFARYFSQRIN